jgi:hypothetical protein
MVTCENCGSYLMLSPDEGAVVSEASGSSRVTVRRVMKHKAPAKAAAAKESPAITNASMPMLATA